MRFERTITTPIGILALEAEDRGLTRVGFEASHRKNDAHPHLDHGERELLAYFHGELQNFTVPLLSSGTPFQATVWDALLSIPFGARRSYADVAKAIGSPKAVRAVGAANGRNPIAIIVPCHRVIASDGSLGGYGGGLEVKAWLLEHESTASR